MPLPCINTALFRHYFAEDFFRHKKTTHSPSEEMDCFFIDAMSGDSIQLSKDLE